MMNKPHSALAGRRILLPVFILLFVLAGVFAVSMKFGTPTMTMHGLFDVLLTGGGEELGRMIVREIRLPRFLLGLLVGAMLAASGTLMQGAMNNRLAGPELLGISAGASLTMASITVFHMPIAFQFHPLFGLTGGLAGGAAVVLSSRGSKGATGMLLMGMSVTAILNGLLIVLIALGTSNDVNLLYTYLLGSLANRSWEHVDRMLPWFLVMLPVAMFFTRAINLLQLGDDTASGLGLKVDRTRIVILIVCAGLVAISVAQCGPIGYISLLAPHLTRLFLRSSDARFVLPLSALCGAVMLTAADQIARLLLSPLEIPVGVWTTLVGGSLFLIFLQRHRGGSIHG
ncbi:FecCD family ABC transporter permease [Paenibacillus harenae]|uniref:FecCD family ABC transporter permease n=1 Tax=Paenibacillus harenae TaxID=306543 RepID=UPI0027925D3C|nr:iron ABC transporter permease [Paenibacillus harenae]MDQ0057842.1 iron complex transport system permease protein [Paenibacillus harenae]